MAQQSPTIQIGLNAVLATVEDDERARADGAAAQPHVLCVREAGGIASLPYGPFDPERHRTFEIGLREWVERQARVRLGFVEQLYTFGDKGRAAPAALIAGGDPSQRVVSVGYLALTASGELAHDGGEPNGHAVWRNWYDFFPWEDWRAGEPRILAKLVLPGLKAWVARARDRPEQEARRTRVALAFGFSAIGWEEERALERYELMYEAGLSEETWRDRRAAGLPPPRSDRAIADRAGVSMASDHRRILATAISRLRGKLKYRAIIFELLRPRFTLLAAQRAVEAIVGLPLHKQNFRRSLEASGLVSKTEETIQQATGRPAALFTVSEVADMDRKARGLSIPRLRRAPSYDWPHTIR